jgi:hypothetical protein
VAVEADFFVVQAAPKISLAFVFASASDLWFQMLSSHLTIDQEQLKQKEEQAEQLEE